jgi:hypothetical protein
MRRGVATHEGKMAAGGPAIKNDAAEVEVVLRGVGLDPGHGTADVRGCYETRRPALVPGGLLTR